jgi:hypothetical protein
MTSFIVDSFYVVECCCTHSSGFVFDVILSSLAIRWSLLTSINWTTTVSILNINYNNEGYQCNNLEKHGTSCHTCMQLSLQDSLVFVLHLLEDNGSQ